jgi:hypothetical protein
MRDDLRPIDDRRTPMLGLGTRAGLGASPAGPLSSRGARSVPPSADSVAVKMRTRLNSPQRELKRQGNGRGEPLADLCVQASESTDDLVRIGDVSAGTVASTGQRPDAHQRRDTISSVLVARKHTPLRGQRSPHPRLHPVPPLSRWQSTCRRDPPGIRRRHLCPPSGHRGTVGQERPPRRPYRRP